MGLRMGVSWMVKAAGSIISLFHHVEWSRFYTIESEVAYILRSLRLLMTWICIEIHIDLIFIEI